MPERTRTSILTALGFFALVFAVKGLGPALTHAVPLAVAALGVAAFAVLVVGLAGLALRARDGWQRGAIVAAGATCTFLLLQAVP